MTQPNTPNSEPLPSSLGFLIKVFGLSTLLAVAIKDLGPRLPFSSSNGLALAVVLIPSLLLGLLLLFRSQYPQ